ncbi:unnamed protein product [Rangifer tarandus platyrhynchus]|uniref:Uncharacterized protein n=1 Tax=Rangifer tarandus platyrhynchus TaxID=3082113 RepID=A0AC59ZPD7_RANTA
MHGISVSIFFLKEINSEYSLEGLMLKLKLQYFGHLMRRADSSEKTHQDSYPDAGKDSGQEEKRLAEEMVEWHHQLNGQEFEQTLGDSEGQGSLACCRPWGHKESDRTERLNNKSNPFTQNLSKSWVLGTLSVGLSLQISGWEFVL